MSTAETHGAPASAHRWRVPAVLAITVFIAYLDRINISLAMPLIAEQYQWSEDQIQHYGGLLMSLFYLGYGASCLLITPFAARLGPRRGIVIIIALASLFTALGAFASQFLLLFAATRILLGVAEGPHLPLGGTTIKQWFPLHERSRANSLFFGGMFVAIIAGPLLLVPLMNNFGWRAAFLMLATAGAALSIPLVLRYIYNTPTQDPHIPAAERQWLCQEVDTVETSTEPSRRFPLYLLKQPDFLLMLAAGTLNNVIAIGLTSWIPTFLTQGRGVAYEQLTWLASLPYVSGLLGLLVFSQWGDRSNRRGYIAAGGYAVLAVAICVALQAENFTLTFGAMALAVFCASAYTSGEYAFAQRIIPHRDIAAGIGMFNGISILVGGSLGPLAASSMLEEGGGSSLVIMVSVAVATGLIMGILGHLKRY
jgi:MFS family permease